MLSPDRDCPRCPRLLSFRAENRARFPDWHNAPVPSFGGEEARAADRRARARATGRQSYRTSVHRRLRRRVAVLDASEVPLGRRELRASKRRWAAPDRVPDHQCRPLRAAAQQADAGGGAVLPGVPARGDRQPSPTGGDRRAGPVAHDVVLDALDQPRARFPFAHGALHRLDGGLLLADSYHCSRQNTNTGRLTPAMFEAVFDRVLGLLSHDVIEHS